MHKKFFWRSVLTFCTLLVGAELVIQRDARAVQSIVFYYSEGSEERLPITAVKFRGRDLVCQEKSGRSKLVRSGTSWPKIFSKEDRAPGSVWAQTTWNWFWHEDLSNPTYWSELEIFRGGRRSTILLPTHGSYDSVVFCLSDVGAEDSCVVTGTNVTLKK